MNSFDLFLFYMTRKPQPTGMRVELIGTEPIFCPKALRIQELALSFPSVRNPAGLDPWSPENLFLNGLSNVSSGTRQALLFVLSVWNPECHQYFEEPPFSVHEALQIWDKSHRKAFLDWANDPWWV